jgi:hypothetical protein
MLLLEGALTVTCPPWESPSEAVPITAAVFDAVLHEVAVSKAAVAEVVMLKTA